MTVSRVFERRSKFCIELIRHRRHRRILHCQEIRPTFARAANAQKEQIHGRHLKKIITKQFKEKNNETT